MVLTETTNYDFTFLARLISITMGARRNFSKGEKPTLCLSFSVCWRCNANGRTQKMSNVTATVTYSVYPIGTFYTEKMFVLVRMDILRLS